MPTPPLAPSPASTILLLRQRERLEAFMVVRHEKLAFGSGALVFPGGKVDPGDYDRNLRRLCRGAGDCDDVQLAHRIAAIREAFEEAGILLARDSSGGMAPGARIAALAPYRQKLERNEIGFGDFLCAESLSLACDEMAHFAHWITPIDRPRRFDTHFFIALAPDDHDAAHDGRESVQSLWANPEEILAQAESGLWKLMTPTKNSLRRLALCANIHDAMHAARNTPVVTVAPDSDRASLV